MPDRMLAFPDRIPSSSVLVYIFPSAKLLTTLFNSFPSMGMLSQYPTAIRLSFSMSRPFFPISISIALSTAESTMPALIDLDL